MTWDSSQVSSYIRTLRSPASHATGNRAMTVCMQREAFDPGRATHASVTCKLMERLHRCVLPGMHNTLMCR